jgi:hypothetical protein
MRAQLIGDQPKRRRPFRLWHLVAAVFVSALAFGGLRGLVRNPNGTGIGVLTAPVLISISVAITFAIIHVGKKLGGGLTDGLIGWAVRRGGVVGFFVWLLGIGINVGFVLTAVLVGPVATVAFLLWLLFRIDGFRIF